jgi:hypothetical protein
VYKIRKHIRQCCQQELNEQEGHRTARGSSNNTSRCVRDSRPTRWFITVASTDNKSSLGRSQDARVQETGVSGPEVLAADVLSGAT